MGDVLIDGETTGNYLELILYASLCVSIIVTDMVIMVLRDDHTIFRILFHWL